MTLGSLFLLYNLYVHTIGSTRISGCYFDCDPNPCHEFGGPTDRRLQCDSSPHQILYMPGTKTLQPQQQRPNLIIFDIDQTILESKDGFHEAIPKQIQNVSNNVLVMDPQMSVVLMFMQHPNKFTILFRRHLFEVLKYVHASARFSADLALYTRARYEYAAQIALGINKCYNEKYHNRSDHLSMYPPHHHNMLT